VDAKRGELWVTFPEIPKNACFLGDILERIRFLSPLMGGSELKSKISILTMCQAMLSLSLDTQTTGF